MAELFIRVVSIISGVITWLLFVIPEHDTLNRIFYTLILIALLQLHSMSITLNKELENEKNKSI